MDIIHALGLSIAFPSRSVYLEHMPKDKSRKIVPPPPDEDYKPVSDDLSQDDYK
jgi:hypothetical protein